jgi:MATE family multidrug resistance protein
VLGAVAPILSQHLGARRYRMVRRTFRQGVWVAAIVALPCIAVIWHAQAILVLLGQDPDLASAGQAYVRFMVLGFLPGLWFIVLNRFLAAHMRPRATLVVVVLGIGLNALADYALMFGHFGFPRLGLIGAGVASAAVSTLMFLALLSFVLIDRRLRRYRLFGRFWRADWSQLYEIVRLGLPIAVAHLAEVGLFLASALLMGLIGTTALAAHAIANQCAVIAYMVPYGIAQAAAVRVGRAVGAGKHRAMARAGWTAVLLGIGFAFLPAAAFLFLGGTIVDLFLDSALPENKTAVDLAVSFLAIVALLQFADATQATSFGALRGLQDTRGPMLISLAGYWGFGLTSAAVFGVYMDFGGEAIWISLVVGVSVVGALLVRRFRVQSLRLINAV